MNKSISVVIPNYNGEPLLGQNLPPLFRALEKAGVPYEVIVPDDASTDQSVPFLRQHFPDILIVESKENKGFSTNTNRGIQRATKELVLVLNSDVELTENYFLPLLKYFTDGQTFGVTGKVIGVDSGALQDAAKYPQYSYANIKGTRNYFMEDQRQGKPWVPSFFLTGANALMDRQKLAELGGYSELFSPFYHEDTELGLRAWRTGYKSYYEPEAICRHPLSVTIRKYSTRRKVAIISKRNKLYLHYLHLNGVELGVWFVLLGFRFLFRGLFFDTRFTKSCLLFFRSLPLAREEKKRFARVQRGRQVQITVREVCREIRRAIQGHRIIKF